MRRLVSSAVLLTLLASAANAQPAPAPAAGPPGEKKENANPCRDEVSSALQKLRKSSWFRMDTNMITEGGPTVMQVDYVLPDKMHQTVSVTATQQKSEIILIGETAWSNDGAGWRVMPVDMMQQLRAQMQESVVEHQTDIGNYSCKGKAQVDGRDVLSYKLEDEPTKDSTAPKNEAYRMFYVDAVTGLPASNALLVPGRDKPIFQTKYAYPVDIKIEPPKDVIAETPPAAGGDKK